MANLWRSAKQQLHKLRRPRACSGQVGYSSPITAPVIQDPAGPETISVGTLFSYDFNLSTPGSCIAAWEIVSGAPIGSTINGATGLLTVPITAPPGTYAIEVRIAGPCGQDTATLNLTIQAGVSGIYRFNYGTGLPNTFPVTAPTPAEVLAGQNVPLPRAAQHTWPSTSGALMFQGLAWPASLPDILPNSILETIGGNAATAQLNPAASVINGYNIGTITLGGLQYKYFVSAFKHAGANPWTVNVLN